MSFNPASTVEHVTSYFNIAKMCLARNNPVVNSCKQLQYFAYCLMTFRQKLAIVKQRVNHMRYRLHQMEQLINDNNKYNYIKGQSLNQIR